MTHVVGYLLLSDAGIAPHLQQGWDQAELERLLCTDLKTKSLARLGECSPSPGFGL